MAGLTEAEVASVPWFHSASQLRAAVGVDYISVMIALGCVDRGGVSLSPAVHCCWLRTRTRRVTPYPAPFFTTITTISTTPTARFPVPYRYGVLSPSHAEPRQIYRDLFVLFVLLFLKNKNRGCCKFVWK